MSGYHPACAAKRRADDENDAFQDERGAKRRLRTNFTEEQSLLLEEAFQASHYPDQIAKRNMAITLDIPEDRITVWFQNRRAKWRRKEMREKERTKCDSQLTDIMQTPLQPYAQEYVEPLYLNYDVFPQQNQIIQQPLPSCHHITFSQNQQYNM